MQSELSNFLLLLFHPFTDLSIGEAVDTPPSDPFFLQVYIASLMPWRLDDPGSNIFHDWKTLEVEGATGGILLFWDKQKMSLVEDEIGSLSITCYLKMWKMGLSGLSQKYTARLR